MGVAGGVTGVAVATLTAVAPGAGVVAADALASAGAAGARVGTAAGAIAGAATGVTAAGMAVAGVAGAAAGVVAVAGTAAERIGTGAATAVEVGATIVRGAETLGGGVAEDVAGLVVGGACSLARRSCSGSTSSSSLPGCADGGVTAAESAPRPRARGSVGASASRGASTGRSGRGSGRDLGSIMSGRSPAGVMPILQRGAAQANAPAHKSRHACA